jgi:6-hydroxynicotinate 3-monooxygenase
MQSDFAHMNRVSMMGELAASLSHEITQPIASARHNARAAQNFLDMQPPDLSEVRKALRCVVGDTNAVVGADGVHSVVRDTLLGKDAPAFTGRVAYRTVFPATLLEEYHIDDCTKWWGPDRHIVIYYVKPDRSEVYFVTSQPEPGFALESWSATGDVNVLRAAFAGFHPQVQRVLASCPAVHKRPLVDHDPLPHWSEGNVTLLGDACHPMTPYMAQGAAIAFEDAAVLSRCLDGVDRWGLADAFRRFESTRKPRTSQVQLGSRTNTWLRNQTNPDWVYGYDAWTAPLVD